MVVRRAASSASEEAVEAEEGPLKMSGDVSRMHKGYWNDILSLFVIATFLSGCRLDGKNSF